MKFYIADELGCVYMINDGILEFAPIMNDDTFTLDDFNPVDEDLVGEEEVKFQGVVTNLSGVYETVRGILS